jgi:hypothetical protein
MHSWSRWSSFVQLALRGGDAFCTRCGSRDIHRDAVLPPPWKRALRIDPCRCNFCGATFHVPRRAGTAEVYEEEEEASMLTLPSSPRADLAALDRAMEERLPRPPGSD